MSTPRRALCHTSVIAALTVLGGTGAAMAQNFSGQNLIKPGEETFTLSLGGIVNEFDTQMRLDGQSRTGSDIQLESNGLKDRHSSFDAAGTWRFLPRHRIDVEYFSAERSGTRSYDSSITIGDDVFPVGATVSAESNSQFLLANYRYSFVKRDGLELAGLIGMYGARFEFDIQARGNESLNAHSASTSRSTTLPLPLIGASLDWYVTPRWKISGDVQGLSANIGDVDGSVFLANASTEYMFMRNFGLGLTYMYSDLKADVDKSQFNGSLDWRMNSIRLYAKLVF